MKLPLREVAAAIDANGKFDGDFTNFLDECG